MIKWQTTVIYVDLETGEILTKFNVQENYQIINKIKKTQFNETNTIGKIIITNECRRSNQLKLYTSEPGTI